MTNYDDAYKQGMCDKDKSKQMDLPDALNNADAFRGYFDGYGGHCYNPPSKRQETVEKNIKKFNFIT